MQPQIKTSTVKNRRPLRFDSVEAALTDARRLAQAEAAGNLESSGNWTLGQALGHLATWAGFAYEKPPIPPPPLPFRLLLRIVKKRILNGSMPAGMRLTKTPDGTLGVERLPTDEALARVERAFHRLQREAPTVPSMAFGRLTQEEAIKLNLRHAELHLSFFAENGSTSR